MDTCIISKPKSNPFWRKVFEPGKTKKEEKYSQNSVLPPSMPKGETCTSLEIKVVAPLYSSGNIV